MKTFDIKIKDKKILSADRNNPSVTSKPFGERLIFFVVLLIIVFGATTLIFAWSNPTVAPPGGNLSGFLDSSSTAQTKSGALTIATSTYLATTGGNVGIGTTGPGAKLDVQTSLSAVTKGLQVLQSENSGTMYGVYAKAQGVGATTNIAGYFSATGATNNYGLIVESGNVGIGTTGPGAKLDVNGIIKIPQANATDNGSPGIVVATGDDFLYDTEYLNHYGLGWHNYQDNGSPLLGANAYLSGYFGIDFFTGGTERLRINYNGNVGIGTTGPGYLLTVNSSTPGCNGCTAWTNYSDIRLKDNVASLSGEIMDKIMQLNPVTFNYNDTYYSQTGYSRPDGTTPTFTGFVAQDLQEIFSEMVNTASSGYLDTNLSNLQIYLVKGIQEQQIQIASLSGQLANLTLTDTGDLEISQDNSGNYVVEKTESAFVKTAVDKIGAYAQLVAANIKAGLVIAKEVTSKKITVENLSVKNLELVDQITGGIYCVGIKNGEWFKKKGSCQ